MRHAAVTLADEANRLVAQGESFDRLFCSDMLNLAEFKGLADSRVAALPSVVYFHENQLTYPVRVEMERDLHFGLTNFTTALAADRVWFNSSFHRESFLEGLPAMLKKMPDNNLLDKIEIIREKSDIFHPGIDPLPRRNSRQAGPPRILWAARWEHDKNPELFFEALQNLLTQGVDFKVSVIGEQFERGPEIFDRARQWLGDRVDRWGYQTNRQEYLRVLLEADIIVSTADHEFFGISVVEAIAAGCWPLLPCRLSYPEILGVNSQSDRAEHFYDGSLKDLSLQLIRAVDLVSSGELWGDDPMKLVSETERFHFSKQGPRMDAALEKTDSALSG